MTTISKTKPGKPKVLDAQAVIRLLKKVVAEKGEDYKDPRSTYAPGCIYGDVYARPACIVGHVIHEAEPLIRLRALNRLGGVTGLFSGGRGDICMLNGSLVQADMLGVTETAREILVRAQQVQDGGNTWGDALMSALEEAQRRHVKLTKADYKRLARWQGRRLEGRAA